MDLKIFSPVPTTKVKNDRMDVDDETVHLVNPGETVTTDQQFMRYLENILCAWVDLQDINCSIL